MDQATFVIYGYVMASRSPAVCEPQREVLCLKEERDRSVTESALCSRLGCWWLQQQELGCTHTDENSVRSDG